MELPDLLSVAARCLGFVLTLQAAGVALFTRIFARGLPASVARLRELGWTCALAAIAVTVAHEALEGARMSGTLQGALDPQMLAIALHTSSGVAFAVTLLGLMLVAAGCRIGSDAVAVGGALVTVVAFTLTGHTTTASHRALAAPLLGVHLLIVEFWLGALVGLHVVCAREAGRTTAEVVARFSAAAVWVVPGIFLAGVLLIALLVPDLGVFRQPYGELLLTKVAMFTALLALAALNRWRLGPQLASGAGAATNRFQRVVAMEYLLICTVLVVTAVMTALYSPEAA